jgi:hypothetical protein
VKRLGLFTDAVDEGLSVLGQSPKEAIYGFLESNYGMERNEIPHRFREFSSILIGTVGPSTGHVLEFIIERFYSKLNLEVPASPTLDETIETVQRILKKQPELPHIEHRLALPP